MDKFLTGNTKPLAKPTSAVSAAKADLSKENIIVPPAQSITKANVVSAAPATEVGQSIPYLALVNTFEAVSEVSGRLDKENLFCKLFREVIATCPSDLTAVVYLASNSISPAYDGLELGIGDSLLIKAICESTGRNKEQVEQAYKTEGDLGLVALSSRANQKTISFAAKPKPMTASYVLDQLRVITTTKGEKAQGRKVDIIKGMMTRCVGVEAKFLIRALQGKLRIGTAEQTVLVSLSKAFVLSPTSAPATAGNEECDDEGDEDEAVPEEAVEGDKEQSTTSAVIEVADAQIEPPEAAKLRKGKKLTTEAKTELAIVAVKRAFSECPNLSILITALLSRPLHLLYQSCHLVAGVPVAPMLAKPTKGIKEVLKRLSGLEFIMEYKYDGERAQVKQH
jgi:DNA ligase 1